MLINNLIKHIYVSWCLLNCIHIINMSLSIVTEDENWVILYDAEIN